MKSKILLFSFVVLLITSLGAISYAEAPVPPKIFELRLVTASPPGHMSNVTGERWAKAVNERTAGRVKVTVYEGTLGKATELYDMVKNRVVDVVHIAVTWTGGRTPICEVGFLPFEMATLSEAADLFPELLYTGLLKELDGVKVLYFTPVEPNYMWLADKKVTKMKELKGMKIRPTPGPGTKLLQIFGATPVSVTIQDVYTALERKSIDGIITAISGGFGYRLFEVSRYLINLPIGVGFFMMLMNKDTLNSLPPDIQLVIEQVNREEECFYVRDYWKNTEEGWQTLRKKMEVYRLSAEEEARWRKAAEPIVEEWIKTMEAKGLPGRQAVEIMRQVARRHKQ